MARMKGSASWWDGQLHLDGIVRPQNPPSPGKSWILTLLFHKKLLHLGHLEEGIHTPLPAIIQGLPSKQKIKKQKSPHFSIAKMWSKKGNANGLIEGKNQAPALFPLLSTIWCLLIPTQLAALMDCHGFLCHKSSETLLAAGFVGVLLPPSLLTEGWRSVEFTSSDSLPLHPGVWACLLCMWALLLASWWMETCPSPSGEFSFVEQARGRLVANNITPK